MIWDVKNAEGEVVGRLELDDDVDPMDVAVVPILRMSLLDAAQEPRMVGWSIGRRTELDTRSWKGNTGGLRRVPL